MNIGQLMYELVHLQITRAVRTMVFLSDHWPTKTNGLDLSGLQFWPKVFALVWLLFAGLVLKTPTRINNRPKERMFRFWARIPIFRVPINHWTYNSVLLKRLKINLRFRLSKYTHAILPQFVYKVDKASLSQEFLDRWRTDGWFGLGLVGPSGL